MVKAAVICMVAMVATPIFAMELNIPFMNSRPFNLEAALYVGGIVTFACVVVITAAIATPFIAITGGAYVATAIAVAGVSLVAGVIGGLAAGLYQGGVDGIKIRENTGKMSKISNQLDITFIPKDDFPNQAKFFECFVIKYEEKNLNTKNLTVEKVEKKIIGTGEHDFYPTLELEINRWLAEKVLGDSENIKRRINVYMVPSPGDSVFKRIKDISQNRGKDRIEIVSIESKWVNAVEKIP